MDEQIEVTKLEDAFAVAVKVKIHMGCKDWNLRDDSRRLWCHVYRG